MSQQYVVIENYECSNFDPIVLAVGDKVLLGEKSNDKGEWANWIYCTSVKTQKCGWTPIQILEIDGDKATSKENYNAIELTVKKGDKVVGYEKLNGWIWCVCESDKTKGWVPQKCLMLDATN